MNAENKIVTHSLLNSLTQTPSGALAHYFVYIHVCTFLYLNADCSLTYDIVTKHYDIFYDISHNRNIQFYACKFERFFAKY